jgi:AcrR family transcriptional regulator
MSAAETRQRILAIAADLFSRQGYTGTTIADIARELGTTTAALYYHFPSKADILGGLLAEPLTAYTRIIESLDSDQPEPPELLGAFIDLAVDSRAMAGLIDRDPAVLAMIDERLPRTSQQTIGQVIAVLAGPGADRSAVIRAHAALAVVKGATMAALESGGGTLDPADRDEILRLALGTLHGPDQPDKVSPVRVVKLSGAWTPLIAVGDVMTTRYGLTMTRAPDAGVPLGRIETPRLVYAVIAVATAAAAFLRFYQLTRPGYLLGVTEYDDGVQFGDAVRLVSGVIPYRDFVVMQPPGSIVLIAPVALLAKVTGTAWGLAIARLLTAAADTACVALLGLLVKHRGPVAAGIACGIYAVYPDALVAAHTFLLEPWMNLFCLIGALLVFDGDHFAEGRRLAWGGVAFGFAAAVKLWALVPLAVVGLLMVRRPRRLGLVAGGAVAGLAVPVLPFLIMAPAGLTTDVVTSQFARANVKHPSPLPRLTDLAGLSLFPHLSSRASALILLIVVAVVAIGYIAACWAGGRLPTALDWYALIGLAAVTGMLLWPFGYWSHYGAVAGPFIALVLALPAGLLRPAEHRHQIVPLMAVCAVALVVIAALGLRQFGNETRTSTSLTARADQLIPPGSCVLTNDSSLTISADRFVPASPGCPAMVDSYGTLLAMTDGRKLLATPQQVGSVTALWSAQFARAPYVWLESGSQGQIPWTPALYAYFTTHFKLLGLVNGPGGHNVPEGALYVRR